MMWPVDVGRQVVSDFSDVFADFARDEVQAVHDISVVPLVLFAALLDDGDDDGESSGDQRHPNAGHATRSVNRASISARVLSAIAGLISM